MASADDSVPSVEKMRIRMAAEGYNGYKTLENEPDAESLGDQELPGKKDSKTGSSKVCTSYDTVLSVLLVVALIVIVALSVLLVVQSFVKEGSDSNTCQTPECIEISASVLTRMNLSVSPCEDFYTYACGGFSTSPDIPPEEAKHSQFSVMDRRSKAIIRKILEDTENTEYKGTNSTAVRKVKQVYSLCMNTTATEQTGIEPLLQLIEDVGVHITLNGSAAWQVDTDQFNLEESLAKLHKYSLPALFGVGVAQDDKDSSTMIIKFDQDGLSFSDITDYLGNKTEKYRNAYTDFFTEVSVLLGAKDDDATRQRALDVWNFEVSLAKIMDLPEARVDNRKLYHKMSLSQLQNLIDSSADPEFNLAEYMELFFGRQIEGQEQVIVYSVNYLGNISSVLKNTSDEILATYLAFGVIQTLLPYLPQRFETPKLKLTQALLGISESPPQWLRCSSRATSWLGFAVGALYTDEHFSEEDKSYINNLLDNIVTQFDQGLAKVTWMDSTTRDRAKEKLDAIGRKIGYPDYIKDPEKLDKHYENLTITDTNSFENALNVMLFATETNLNKLGQKPDPEHWSMAPTEINAYYSPSHNEMVFPAGILTQPFYSSSFASAMNYGSMGFIMGHELTHGFDNTGRLFDKEGNMDNWWTDDSAQQFDDKTQCLIDQYENYIVQDSHLNGRTTLGENMADNGGLKTSYAAYQKWLKAHRYEDANSKLPALNATREQLFYLAFAQTWCTYMTPEYEKAAINTDVHSNPKYRVIGTLANNAKFSEAYSCKKGSPMNPSHKCSVW